MHGRMTDWLGRLLVVLQFVLMAAMAWRALRHGWPEPGIAVACGALLAGSAALAAWTLQVNRPGNFNIRPTPKAGGSLVTHGPYRWIRHPMYGSVLTAALAAALASGGPLDTVLWVALLVVLMAKAFLEEEALLARFEQYRGYRQTTKRLIPWLW